MILRLAQAVSAAYRPQSVLLQSRANLKKVRRIEAVRAKESLRITAYPQLLGFY